LRQNIKQSSSNVATYLVLVFGIWYWYFGTGIWYWYLIFGTGIWYLVLVFGTGIWYLVLVFWYWYLVLVFGTGIWYWYLIFGTGIWYLVLVFGIWYWYLVFGVGTLHRNLPSSWRILISARIIKRGGQRHSVFSLLAHSVCYKARCSKSNAEGAAF